MGDNLEKADQVGALRPLFGAIATVLLRSAAAGLLILLAIGCSFLTAFPPCSNDDSCGTGRICEGTCRAGCRTESPECPLGTACEESADPSIGVCFPIVCADDPLVCPPRTICWPPPETGDPLGSQCMPPTRCDGGSIFDAPACSEGGCDRYTGLTCGLVGETNDQGVPELGCACVPAPQ